MEFKRGLWSLIKSLTVAIFAPAFVFFIVLMFSSSYFVPAIVAGLVFIFAFYTSLFSENIRFVIENGEFKYFKNGKLKETFILKETNFRYRIKSTSDGTGTSHDINLYVSKLSDIKDTDEISETLIDCSPIGIRKFEKMFDLLGGESNSKTVKLKTKKKEDK